MLKRGKKNNRNNNKVSPVGIANIKTTPNNTMISISDLHGNIICWSTSGSKNFGVKFENAKKKTAYAIQSAARFAAFKAKKRGIECVSISIKGVGKARDISIRALKFSSIRVTHIEDKTNMPHNGCRFPNKRRL